MTELDGNAIAGDLQAVFGREMTAVAAVCAHCGRSHALGEERVWMRGPGTVVRCRSCAGVVLVLVEIRGRSCVDLRGIAKLV